MITPEQRRKLEAKWSQDDRTIASRARLFKGAVLMVFVLGLAWIGSGGENPDSAQLAFTTIAAPAAPHQAEDGDRMRAGR
jgi:hypothetical protein